MKQYNFGKEFKYTEDTIFEFINSIKQNYKDNNP